MRKRNVFINALLILCIYTFSFNSRANTITVTTINDAGVGSFREAINTCLDGDVINFDAALISSGSTTINLTSGQLYLDKSITINGLFNATDTLYVSGNNQYRVLYIRWTTNVYIDSVVFINGSAPSDGGAIRFKDSDSLFVSNSTFFNNQAYYGGAIGSSEVNALIVDNCQIYNNDVLLGGGGIDIYYSDYLKVINSSIFNNTASDGGGIESSVFVDIVNSTIRDNTATGNGGGVYAYTLKVLDVKNSTINNNSATKGGGVFTKHFVNITNSTIFENEASNSGGGVYGYSISAPDSIRVNITNSTVYKNTATNDGGGILVSAPISSKINIEGSIVAFNGNDNLNNVSSPTIVSDGYNIFDNAPNGTIASDLINTTILDLNLDALNYNGGDTKTLLPLDGSVAINSGNSIDFNDAQNGQIVGVREIGAAETCDMIISTTLNGSTINSNNVTANSYQWVDCNNGNAPISGETLISFTPISNGNYAVITYEGNCADTSDCVLITKVGVGVTEFNNLDLSLFPNPNNGRFILSTNIVNGFANIYSVDGKLIIDNIFLNNEKTNISLEDLNQGIYFISVFNDSSQKTIRFVIE